MDGYAYSNARIRAMRGRLLNRAWYETLLGQDTFGGLVEALKNSPYGPMLAHPLEGVDASRLSATVVQIDEALRLDLTRNLSRLRHFHSDRPLELVDLLCFRWDVYNVKTILRAKRAAAQVQEILAMTFPIGVLDEVALAELARVPTLHAVANLLDTWRLPLARPVRMGLKLLGETETLQPLEFELDRFMYVYASKQLADGNDNARAVKNYVRFLVDKANLLTALRYLAERSALSPIEAVRHFLDADGRFTPAHFEAIAGARDLRDGLSKIAATPYGWLTRTFAGGERISLPLIERKLDHMALGTALNFARQDPLGIGMAITYLEQKTNEIRNLRMILRAKVAGMDNELTREWLII